MTSKNKKPKRSPTRFVPRIVLGVAVSCVVPACVAGCGPMLSVAADAFGVAADAFGVADVGFQHEAGVADIAFRPDATVADVGFTHDASDAIQATVAADAFSVADTGFGDAPVDAAGVADVGFGPG